MCIRDRYSIVLNPAGVQYISDNQLFWGSMLSFTSSKGYSISENEYSDAIETVEDGNTESSDSSSIASQHESNESVNSINTAPQIITGFDASEEVIPSGDAFSDEIIRLGQSAEDLEGSNIRKNL